MFSAHHLPAVALCLAVSWTSGCCVAPWACGTNACGPIALGARCGGCGQCDGCGELYVDPWINHPPDCCDPCDSCGNYNGQSCGKCRSVFAGVRTLWGYRCDDGSGCDATCGHEVACGHELVPPCEPGCGCESCVPQEVACGIEAGCGIEHSCGLEAACGLEVPPAMSYPTASSDRAIRITSEPPLPPQSVRSSRPSLRPYPQDTPRIFKPRTEVADRAIITGSR